jgi:hypothetical protein
MSRLQSKVEQVAEKTLPYGRQDSRIFLGQIGGFVKQGFGYCSGKSLYISQCKAFA